MVDKTNHFFVNEEQISYLIENVCSSPLLFALSCSGSPTVEVISVQKLHRPSVDTSIKCEEYFWK
jgi:hypothetical protein